MHENKHILKFMPKTPKRMIPNKKTCKTKEKPNKTTTLNKIIHINKYNFLV